MQAINSSTFKKKKKVYPMSQNIQPKVNAIDGFQKSMEYGIP